MNNDSAVLRYENVRGFNYQPGYAFNSYEAWRFFDADAITHEIERGKRYFPGINTIRLWLSYDAYRYEEERQCCQFEQALQICDRFGLKVIPVLFNCWHDATMDNGGIYHPQMIPGSIWSTNESMFDRYIRDIVGQHKDDGRILAWDVCNEPDSFGYNAEYAAFMTPYQDAWLSKMLRLCHEAGATQPCGISFCDARPEVLEKFANEVDIFLIHDYFFNPPERLKLPDDTPFLDSVLKKRAVAEKYNKPILCTETCWGSLDDAERTEIIRRTLTVLRAAHIGFVAHALAYSHVADLHYAEDGPVGCPGNLCFINKDGSLRQGHEIFNEF